MHDELRVAGSSPQLAAMIATEVATSLLLLEMMVGGGSGGGRGREEEGGHLADAGSADQEGEISPRCCPPPPLIGSAPTAASRLISAPAPFRLLPFHPLTLSPLSSTPSLLPPPFRLSTWQPRVPP